MSELGFWHGFLFGVLIGTAITLSWVNFKLLTILNKFKEGEK